MSRDGKTRWRALGWITGAAGIGLIIGTAPFISPAFRKYCLPYVPATPIQVSLIKEIFKKLPSKQKVIDLGSGDGRIVISLAKGGHIGVGVEVNYWLVLLSRFKSILNGVRKNTKFHWKNLWTVNLKGYDCVIIFGVEDMMKPLASKIIDECSSDECYVISCRFPFPHWSPLVTYQEGPHSVWLYHIQTINNNNDKQTNI